jgi:raffinose/stachyose/melibiose transport system substrate-binding protein
MTASFGRPWRHRLAIAIGAVAAMASVQAVSAATTITWLHLETNQSRLATWHEIASGYEALHPDVHIEFQFLDNEAFKAKLPTLLQSDNAPSMFYTWAGGVLKEQSETGKLRDVTDAMNADDGAWRKTLNPAAVNGVTFNDKIWAVPTHSGVVAFWYNKKLFAQAGVDGESIKTWADFTDAVKKLRAAGIAPIAAGGGDKWPLQFFWSYLTMREVGQEGFAAARAGGGFMTDSFIAASQKLIDLGKLEAFQKGFVAASWPDAAATFADGRAALLLAGDNTATPANQALAATDGKGLAPEDIGRFPFPVIEGTPGLVTDDFGGLNGWVVTKNAPPETVDFLKFYTELDNAKKLAAQGVIPTTFGGEAGLVEPSMKLSAEQMGKETWHQNYLDQDLGPNVGRVVNDISAALAAGQISAQDAVQQVQDAFELEM